MPQFKRYIGIDYSGAGKPDAPLRGIQVFIAEDDGRPRSERVEGHRNWTRRRLAEWLEEKLAEPVLTIVGIDHGFSLPRGYLDKMELKAWDDFLRHFLERWDTRSCAVHEVLEWEEFIVFKAGAKFRLTEKFTSSAKSIFDPNGPGVAHSTFAGIPWLAQLRLKFRDRVHFWPFDGWEIRTGQSCIAEVYPSLFAKRFDPPDEKPAGDARDACAVCRWLQLTDARGFLPRFLQPALTLEETRQAEIEGWILGVA